MENSRQVHQVRKVAEIISGFKQDKKKVQSIFRKEDAMNILSIPISLRGKK